MASIVATYRTDAFSSSSSEPRSLLAIQALLSPFWDSLQNVYGSLLTRIYTEQISASLQLTWIRVFSDNPSLYKHFCRNT